MSNESSLYLCTMSTIFLCKLLVHKLRGFNYMERLEELFQVFFEVEKDKYLY